MANYSITSLDNGEYKLFQFSNDLLTAPRVVFIENLSDINQKKYYFTYKAVIRFNENTRLNVYIKSCHSMDYALNLAKQFDSFNNVTDDSFGVTSPTVVGCIKSPPCIITKEINGETLTNVLKRQPSDNIEVIGNRVGLFLAKYHQRYFAPDSKDRLVDDLLDFALLNNLNVNRVKEILNQATLATSIVHRDPKPENFLWDNDKKIIGVLDPTHRPYVRFVHFDFAIVLFFPLYIRNYHYYSNIKKYRASVIKSYCEFLKFDWTEADEALAAINLLQLYDRYKKDCFRFGLLRGVFYSTIIKMRQRHFINKFLLK